MRVLLVLGTEQIGSNRWEGGIDDRCGLLQASAVRLSKQQASAYLCSLSVPPTQVL